MHIVDWAIVVAFLTFLISVGVYCRKYIRGVADFLIAGRGVGKYLGGTAAEAANVGVISLVYAMQAAYFGGLSFYWFKLQSLIGGMLIAVTGWAIYRLRESRVLTINELLERRYSKNVRIFSGFLCFTSGILNMAVFPVIEGRFFVYFIGLPPQFSFFGLCMLPTVHVISLMLVALALVFCFISGQIGIIVTDFIQGSVILIMFLTMGIVAYRVVNWSHIHEAIMSQPEPAVMLNPFSTSKGAEFGLSFMLIMLFNQFYRLVTSAPTLARNQATTSPHEAKMMRLFSKVKFGVRVSMYFVPVAALAFMTLPCFREQSQFITNAISGIANEKVQSQLIVPMFLRSLLPIGLMGLFTASLIALSISTYDTYFLGWAGTFVQDVYGPLRKKPMEVKSHLRLLRWSTVGVGLVVWGLSLLYRDTDYIIMTLELLGAIFVAGAGCVLLGALYWRRATTAGAWAALIVGAVVATTGLIIKQTYGEQWPLNGTEMAAISWFSAIIAFVVVSFLTPNPHFDLEGLLHREPKKKSRDDK
jgi:solute:Na+ symporter, SSS family